MPDPVCTVSVIVPTHNRAATLRKNLDTVLAQEYGSYEAVYVDDGSMDDTPEILRDCAAEHRDRFRWVRTACGAPGPARNAGVERARGEFLLFTDDDVTVPPVWITGMLGRYAVCGCSALCGGVAPESLETMAERYLHARMQTRLGARPRRIRAAPMMNFLIPRAIFLEAGGFSKEPLEAAEDWEFCIRLRAAGHTIAYDPAVSVTHRYQRDMAPAIERMRAAGSCGVRMQVMRGRPVAPYVAYSLLRSLTSPVWAPFRYPLSLYATAARIEWIFGIARLKAYAEHLSSG